LKSFAFSDLSEWAAHLFYANPVSVLDRALRSHLSSIDDLRLLLVLSDDKIEIPPSALEVKAWFPDLPSDEIVTEIRTFIRETQQPWLWRGHTHTKPPPGAPVEYLGEVHLPDEFKTQRHRWAPCPCCVPYRPKWRKDGRIAWFPEERVIRILGGDCFKAINSTGHFEAIVAMRRRESERKSLAYLASNAHLAPEIEAAVRAAIPAAAAVMTVKSLALRKLQGAFRINLWPHISGGLKVREKVSEGDDRMVSAFVPFNGTLQSTAFFDPAVAVDPDKLRKIADQLAEIPQSGFDEVQPKDREKHGRMLGRGLSAAREAFEAIERIRSMFRSGDIGTLRRWGSDEDAPIRFFIEFNDGRLRMGRAGDQTVTVQVPDAFWAALRPLPEIAAR